MHKINELGPIKMRCEIIYYNGENCRGLVGVVLNHWESLSVTFKQTLLLYT